jgi:zinc and cadmium transporter
MNSLYAIFSVVIVSLISFVGILAVIFKKSKLQDLLFVLVSFSVGALFGDAFIHLLPQTFEKIPSPLLASILIMVGILIFFSLEKYIRWHHCHLEEKECEHNHHVGTMNIVGDGVHNLIDGLLIGASYLVSIPLGIATTTAIVLHEIPSEIGEFGVLLHSGLSVKKAVFYNFLSAALAILGAAIALIVGTRISAFADFLIPVAAGGFIYIAGSDLIPELHTDTTFKNSVLQIFSIALGILIMALLLYLD